MPTPKEIEAALDAVLKAAWKRGAKIGLGFRLHKAEVREAIVIALGVAERVRKQQTQAQTEAVAERLRKL
jgi:hypothetical protein